MILLVFNLVILWSEPWQGCVVLNSTLWIERSDCTSPGLSGVPHNPATLSQSLFDQSSQVSRIEWMREEVAQLIHNRLLLQVANDDLDVASVLPEELSARATGWGEGFCCGHDGDLAETRHSF